MNRKLFLAAAGVLLAGCTHQKISVVTKPEGATCTFERRGAKIGTIKKTPDSLKVIRSRYPIDIRCSKRGYHTASHQNRPGHKTSFLESELHRRIANCRYRLKRCAMLTAGDRGCLVNMRACKSAIPYYLWSNGYYPGKPPNYDPDDDLYEGRVNLTLTPIR